MKALKDVFDLNTQESDLVLLEKRYKSNCKFLRQDLMTLLNNWNTEIDRAANDLQTNGSNSGKPDPDPTDINDLRNYL